MDEFFVFFFDLLVKLSHLVELLLLSRYLLLGLLILVVRYHVHVCLEVLNLLHQFHVFLLQIDYFFGQVLKLLIFLVRQRILQTLFEVANVRLESDDLLFISFLLRALHFDLSFEAVALFKHVQVLALVHLNLVPHLINRTIVINMSIVFSLRSVRLGVPQVSVPIFNRLEGRHTPCMARYHVLQLVVGQCGLLICGHPSS